MLSFEATLPGITILSPLGLHTVKIRFKKVSCGNTVIDTRCYKVDTTDLKRHSMALSYQNSTGKDQIWHPGFNVDRFRDKTNTSDPILNIEIELPEYCLETHSYPSTR